MQGKVRLQHEAAASTAAGAMVIRTRRAARGIDPISDVTASRTRDVHKEAREIVTHAKEDNGPSPSATATAILARFGGLARTDGGRTRGLCSPRQDVKVIAGNLRRPKNHNTPTGSPISRFIVVLLAAASATPKESPWRSRVIIAGQTYAPIAPSRLWQ